VAAGGHVVTGSIDGARRSDLGKTLDVTVRGDRAYTRSLRTPIVLLAVGFAIASFMGIVVPVSLARANRRAASRAATPATTQAEVPAAMSVEDAVRRIRKLRRAGRLAEAVALVDRLGPYGVNDEDDWDTSLGASVLAAYAEQISAIDPEGARAAYKRAGQLQRAFASGATSGGEGVARIGVAEGYEAKAR
jgi:hypothetical protein